MKRTVRYQAAIVDNDHVLLLKVIDHVSNQTYWVIPGGGREGDESEVECVQREVREETHLHVAVERLILDELGVPDGIYQQLKTYVCRVTGGEPQPGTEPEVDTADHSTIQEVRWFDLRDPTTWDTLALNDSFTYPLLQRLRSALGYIGGEVV